MASVNLSNLERTENVLRIVPQQLLLEKRECWPKLFKMFGKISESLSNSGSTMVTRMEEEEHKKILKVEKLRWLHVNILHKELQNLLLNHDIESMQLGDKTKKIYQILRESPAEAEGFINCNPLSGVGVSLLGLNHGSLKKHDKYSPHLASVQQQLIPEIEDRLAGICTALVEMHDTSKDVQDCESPFASATTLVKDISNERLQLEALKDTILYEQDKKDKLISTYCKELHECLQVLNTILTQHCLSSQQKKDEITSIWLTARCEAMLLKMKVLELELLNDTYTPKTTPALSVIRHHLDSAISKLKVKSSDVNHALAQYEACGPEFENLVKEYTSIKEDIDVKQWALREFEHYQEADN